MKFSILTAHYNNGRYLQQCYESIQKQTFQDFEWIIVDDASTDDSVVLIQNLIRHEPRAKLYLSDKNRGVGYTKKRAVEFSTGDVCGFLDPDDALVPEAVEICLQAFENSKVKSTYSEFYLCDEHLKIQKKFPNTRRVKKDQKLFFNINFEISHFFCFRKKDYYLTEGIQKEFLIAEDMDLYLKFYELGGCHHIPQTLYLYRVHPKGLSHDTEKTTLKNQTWHTVLQEATKRRKISTLYGQSVDRIACLPQFLRQKQNVFWRKLLKKMSW